MKQKYICALIIAVTLFGYFSSLPRSVIAQPLTEEEQNYLELTKRLQIARTRNEFLSLIPRELHSCISSEVTGGKLWSSVAANGVKYYFLGLIKNNSDYNYQEAIFKAVGRNCQILTPLDSREPFSYLKYLDNSIVLPLIVGKYQTEIEELGGEEPFVARNFANFGDPSWDHYLSLEQIKALEQLGIEFPSTRNLFVISPRGIYRFDPSNQ